MAHLLLTSPPCLCCTLQLMQVLKLPKEKWDEAKEHSKRAVIADNRLRVWYQDPTAMDVGLLFPCNLGQVALDQPAGECWCLLQLISVRTLRKHDSVVSAKLQRVAERHFTGKQTVSRCYCYPTYRHPYLHTCCPKHPPPLSMPPQACCCSTPSPAPPASRCC